MDDSKVFMFPGMGNTGNNSTGFDPNLMYALNNGGGMGGNWMWIIFLFFLYGWNRGGNLFGANGAEGANLGNMINNDNGRELLMQAINGNRNAIDNLATTLNCNHDSITSAINCLQTNLQSVGNQVGMGTQQVVNSIQAGNATLAQQLASCCCENRLATCQQTNTLTSRIDQLANGMQTGFAQIGYNQATNTANIIQAGNANTQRIVDTLNNHWQSDLQQRYADAKLELSQLNQNATLIAALKTTTTGA